MSIDLTVPTHHQRRILASLRDHGPRSAGQLTDRVGLSRSKVGQELARLMGAGLIEHVGYGKSQGGRRSELVDFASRLRFVGVDVGVTSLDVAVTDGRLGVLDHVAEPIQIESGPETVLALVGDCIAKMRARGVLDEPDGVGLGLPGPVSFVEGVAVAPPLMPSWHRYPVGEVLTRRLSCPVSVDNDVNLMALGEMHAGVGRSTPDFLFVKIGTGIGCGIAAGGRLHRGASGSAGDIGHIALEDSGPVCTCGRTGCLEAWFSGPALVRDATAVARREQAGTLADALQRDGSLSMDDVVESIAAGEAATIELVHAGGRRVGRVLAGLVNFFNPALIVIGGGLSALGHPLLAEIRGEVFQRSTPLASSGLPVVMSELGGAAGVVGAASLIRDRLFGTDQIPVRQGAG